MPLEYCLVCDTVRVKADRGQNTERPCAVCNAEMHMFLPLEIA